MNDTEQLQQLLPVQSVRGTIQTLDSLRSNSTLIDAPAISNQNVSTPRPSVSTVSGTLPPISVAFQRPTDSSTEISSTPTLYAHRVDFASSSINQLISLHSTAYSSANQSVHRTCQPLSPQPPTTSSSASSASSSHVSGLDRNANIIRPSSLDCQAAICRPADAQSKVTTAAASSPTSTSVSSPSTLLFFGVDSKSRSGLNVTTGSASIEPIDSSSQDVTSGTEEETVILKV